jgi:CelD/BcsL family acetyltransferase involved in cellulose biosynthesis
MIRCSIETPDSSSNDIWNDWQRLMVRAAADQQMFGPDWFRIWADTWGSTGQWTGQSSIVTARDEAGILQGLLALGRPQIGPLTVYATGGHDVPHRGIIAATGHEAAVGAAIGDFIAGRKWPLIQIGPVRDSAPADRAMIDQLCERGIHLQQHNSYEEITLHAPDSWDEYRSDTLGSKFARKVGYYERRMARAGHTEIRHFRQPTVEETESMFADMHVIEAASWMATREKAVPRFANPNLIRFWTQLTIEHLSPRDHLDCWVMSFDGHPVSFCFTLTDGTTRYAIANNYDNTVRDHRTGSTLYWKMIQDGIERGVRRFEFGDGDLHYKTLWGAGVEGCRRTYLAVPNRLVGCAASAAHRVRQWVTSTNAQAEEVAATEVADRSPVTARA